MENEILMTPNLKKRIKILMVLKGVSQASVMKKYGFDKGDISKVVSGVRTTYTIRQAIAQELGLAVDVLFAVSK